MQTDLDKPYGALAHEVEPATKKVIGALEVIEHPAFFKVVVRAWSDAEYKAELLSNPASALAKMGLSPPEGVALEVHEDTPEKMHLILPVAPPNYKVDDQEWDDWTS